MAFTTYTGSDVTTLTTALLAPDSGIAVSNILLNASSLDAVNFYDGTLAPLGIGAGLLLTSGTTPGTSNTVGWFGTDNSGSSTFYNGDADIDAVVNTVFQTQSYDATTLEFDFIVADVNATSVSFDVVFGSDEFPEWVDQFVDCAIVMVNGVNYALFNHDPLHPLSVVSSNLAAGYFQDNAGNVLPIEYDGVSHMLKIVAPIIPGGATNHIKIGIADTGDHIYDSGIFIANLTAGNIPGSGVVSSTTGTGDNDTLTGSSQAEYFDLQGGSDVCYAGAGDDIVVAGSGNDSVFGGSGADEMKGDAGDDCLDGGADADTAVFSGASTGYIVASVGGSLTISSAAEGTDTLTSVEFAKFSDGLFTISTSGLTPVSNPGTPPSNTPGSVVISGIGSVGNILTATVSDPDGVSGAVTYQWQASLDGTIWSNVGADSNTYAVSAADVGKDIQVVASYTDNGSQAESPVSASKTILNANGGDLVVTLMQLDAPPGASVINPLTTLVQDAIDLGLSPNMAALTIKGVLGLPDEINLQTYDAFAVLQTNPNDAAALAVEKAAVQVAILTSLSDDDTGVNLTLAVLNANKPLNLADAGDLANILGIDITGITDKNLYPEPLREIFDRNDNIAQAGNVSGIDAEWQNFLSIQDFVASTSIADLSIHVNQAPTGVATASLIDGLEGTAYLVSASDLLQGLSDTDGGTLSVSGLSADNGAVTDNGDGTFTITPALNYVGPVELTYTVLDGQTGSAPANQLFVIAPNQVTPGNTAPATSDVTLAAIAEDSGVRLITQVELLVNAGDVDGDILTATGLTIATGSGTLGNNGDGTWNYTPALNDDSSVSFSYNVTDGIATVAGSATLDITPVNDAPTTSAVTLTAIVEDSGVRVITQAELLGDAADVDGPALSATGLAISSGMGGLVDNLNGTWNYTPALNDDTSVSFSYNVTDGSLSAVGSATLDITPHAGVTLTGNAKANILTGSAYDDTLSGLGGNDTLNGLAGNDTLLGGTGNDTYVVDSAGDVVTEAAGAGTDLVQASVSCTLSANVENLKLTGTAADATGNALANTLTGNSGDNVLDSGAGNDTLVGGNGNDVLIGGAGNDTLVGGAGSDNLWGGSGADIFRFDNTALSAATNLDTILDFNPIDDTIQLENAIFSSLKKTGTLAAGNFHVINDGTALDANDFIQYNDVSGALYYDADGSGAGTAIQFATLIGIPAVTAADFMVI